MLSSSGFTDYAGNASEELTSEVKRLGYGNSASGYVGNFVGSADNELRLRMLESLSSVPGGPGPAVLGKINDVLDDPVKYLEETGGTAADLESLAALQPKRRRRRSRDSRSVVPIAAGADATDRELYNSVRTLYISVRKLNNSIRSTPSGDDEDKVQSRSALGD